RCEQGQGIVDVESIAAFGALEGAGGRGARRRGRRVEQGHRSSLAPSGDGGIVASLSSNGPRTPAARWQTSRMVTLLLDSTRLEVALSKVERALSFRKENVLIERSTIKKVQLTDDAWMWLRGVPDP